MSIDTAIFQLVTNDAAVAALIEDRLFPVNIPQGFALPAMTYNEIGGPDEMTTDGSLGLIDGRFQFNCFAATHPICVDLLNAMINLIKQNYSGVLAGVTIQGTQIVGRGDIPAIDIQAEQLSRFGKYLDCIICYEE